MADKKNLTAKQHKAISALVSGATRQEAAAAAGVNESTVYKWQRLDIFQAELRKAENLAITTAQGQLIARIEENLAILDEIKKNTDASDNARIRAIQLELDTMLQWRNLAILEERIEEIEKQLEKMQ